MMPMRSMRYDRVPPGSNEQGMYDTVTNYDNGTSYRAEAFNEGLDGDNGEFRRRAGLVPNFSKGGMNEGVSFMSREDSQHDFRQAPAPPPPPPPPPPQQPQQPQPQPLLSRSRRPMIRDSVWQILFCLTLFILPLALTAVLMYLVYVNAEPTARNARGSDTSHSITQDNLTRPLSGQEYYVNYSATRLVFISSLSSTLALALVPVGMTLFTYKTASTLQKASASQNIDSLPTPYQFELCIRLLGGGAIDLYRYLEYWVKRGSRKVPAVEALVQAVLILAFLLALAVAITITDALLHVKTSTVQYHRTTLFTNADFSPGRNLPQSCVQYGNSTDYEYYACNIIGGGSGARQLLNGSAEAFRVLGNISETSFIQMADDGKTSIITMADAPSDVSYTAQSFASSTVCETVTKRCYPHYNGGDYDASQQWAYSCSSQNASLVMSGNFSYEAFQASNPVLQFYNSSSKTENGSGYLYTAVDGNIWSSALFSLPNADFNISHPIDGSTYYNSTLDLIRDTYGNIYGIFSCNTTLSVAQYTSSANGSISNITLTPMNNSAAAPFFQAVDQGYGNDNLRNGLNIASVSSDTASQLAYEYSRVFDRTILGLTAAYLNTDSPLSAQKILSAQVAKIPIPEFIALNALNLLLTFVGVLLTIVALILRLRPGVADIRARLDVGALVATLFEDERLEHDARKLQDMYAELRGLPSSRVMAADPGLGGRRGFVAVKEVDDLIR